jgi:hypothetical protein
MAQAIYYGTLEHDALSESAIHPIVEQLRKHPATERILTSVISPDDFKSAFKCVPEKTASSFLGRDVHHYKTCAEESDDGLADIQVEVHVAMMTVPLDAGLCPERWKQAVDVMLEKCLESQDPTSYISYIYWNQISIKFYESHLQEI